MYEESISRWRSKEKVSATHRGISLEDWNGYNNSFHKLERKTREYTEWRSEVLKRDDYTCQFCFKKGGKLQAHHIENYSSQKELRFVVENGICLCENCHNLFHTTFGRHNNNEIQLQSFIDNFDIYNENVLCKVA